jgi:glycerol-3-phosphate dehydrogenase (NAD(P)+)
MKRVAVLGAGAWGTVLALLIAMKGRQVTLWGRDEARMAELRRERQNRRYLPGVVLPETITVTADLESALTGAEAVVFAVPAAALADVGERAAPHLPAGILAVCATKGIDPGSLRRPSEVLTAVLARQRPTAGHGGEAASGSARPRIAVLAGPSLAREVARLQPTAVVAAAAVEADAVAARDLFHSETFRVYSNTDLVGVETGVAVKNVIAIAAGMGDGLGLGDNARGALLTRGLAEMTRFGTRLGALPETFYGLAGMGDLIATCASRLSRNRHVGEELGRGRPLGHILGDMVHVAEGVPTALAVHRLARTLLIDMPITDQVHAVLYEGQDARSMLGSLMSRQPKSEVG